MKKLIAGCMLVSTLTTLQIYAALPTANPPCLVSAPSLYGGLAFGISVYAFEGLVDQSDYALTFNRIDDVTKAPILHNGTFHSPHNNESWGLKLNLGYVFPCTNDDIYAAYTTMKQTSDDRTVNPTSGFTLFSTISSGSGVSTLGSFSNELSFFDATFPFGDLGFVDLTVPVPINLATARVEIDYNAWDVEFGQHLNVGSRLRLRIFEGLRVVNLDSELKARYQGIGTASSQTVTDTAGGSIGTANFTVVSDLHVEQKSTFDGIGPRLGANGSFHLGNGFGLVAEASTAVIIGDMNSRFDYELPYIITGRGITGEVAGETITDTSHIIEFNQQAGDTNRFIPNLEGKVGIDYSYQLCNCSRTKITAELGYMATEYWNSSDRINRTVFNPNTLKDNTEVRTEIVERTYNTNFSGFYFNIQILI